MTHHSAGPDDLLAHDVSGEGPAILFIHGTTFSRRTWDPIVDRLLDRFRCLVADMPGHGESTGSAADPRVVAARFHATATAAGIDAPVVVGHSAGAIMATGYGAMFPSAGVVNIDQPMYVAPFGSFVAQLAPALRGPDFESAFAPFRQSIGLDRLPEPERTRAAATQRVTQDLVLDAWTLPMSTPPDEQQAQIDELLDAINVPYLLLAGDPVDDGVRDHLLAHVPGAEIETWPGNGHMVHLAEPDRFAERLAVFVTTASSVASA